MRFCRSYPFVGALVIAAVLVGASGIARAALVGNWKLDETDNSNLTAYDSSGNHYDGTRAYMESPPPPPGGGGDDTGARLASAAADPGTYPGVGYAGVIGGSYLFHGDTAVQSEILVNAAGTLLTGTNNFTLSTWLNMPSAMQSTYAQNLSLFRNWGSSWNYILSVQVPIYGGDPRGVMMAVYNAIPALAIQQTQIGLDGWHQVTGSYNGSTVRLYVDGELAASKDYVREVLTEPTFSLGGPTGPAVGNTGSFRGYLDDMGVWNETLADVQVRAIYNTPLVAGLNAPATGRYGLGDMSALFNYYNGSLGDQQPPAPVVIGDVTWNYDPALPDGMMPGSAWFDGTSYHIKLGATDGVTGSSGIVWLPGDANKDGTVDGADLNTVLSNYNQTGMDWAHGDFNNDATVDGADLNTVLSNYNQHLGAGSAPGAPEPSTLLLAAAGLVGLLAYGWRKRAWR
jgi:hypothetical protein